MEDPEFQERLLATFAVEAEEHLANMTSGLLELEREPTGAAAPALVDTVFREAHSLKGAARSVGNDEVAGACQHLENVFALLKKGARVLSPELADSLHAALEQVRGLTSGKASAEKTDLAATLSPWEHTSGSKAPLERATQAAKPALAQPAPERSSPPSEPQGATARPRAGLESAAMLRVSAQRLEAVLFEAEEALGASLNVAERAAELDRVRVQLEHWEGRWRRVRTGLKDEAGSDAALSRPYQDLLDFANWNAQLVQNIHRELARVCQRSERDRRVLSGGLANLLEATKELLMLPFGSVIERLQKIVRDLAREQGKEAVLHVEGAEIELDRRILDQLRDALIHLLRNTLDHGIEPPAERERRGKPAAGAVNLAITQRNAAYVELVLRDDGAGLDIAALKAQAERLGLRTRAQLQAMAPEHALELIFESGFSTAPALTELSGRGLGLAIVRESVERLGGAISVESRLGAGTAFRIVVPSTFSRFRALLLRAAGRPFFAPTGAVVRVLRVRLDELRPVENRKTLRLDGETVPVLKLAELLGLSPLPGANGSSAKTSLVVLEFRQKRLAFIVDEILEEQDVLMKSLGSKLSGLKYIAGATVQADGRLVPVLNIRDLFNALAAGGLRHADASSSETLSGSDAPPKARKSVLVAEDSITSRTLLKNILQGAGYAVETALDGADALALLQSRPFDLLLSDVDMPRLNGFELTEKVRHTPELSQLPVVLVTALGSTKDRERGLEAGANAYVVKSSFAEGNLLEVVGRLLG